MSTKKIICIVISIFITIGIIFGVCFSASSNNNLSGKVILNFGDSIFGNAAPPNDISTHIAKTTKATVYNCGFGGTRMSSREEKYWDAFSMYRLSDAIASGDWSLQNESLSSANRIPYAYKTMEKLQSIDFNNVDIITISLGTNDYTGSVLLDDDTKYSTNTFGGALRYSIEKIQSAYPNIQIVLTTPIYRFWRNANGRFLFDSDTHEKNGQKLTDFAQKVKDIANEYNLNVIDNYNHSGINYKTRNFCFSDTDSTHPNKFGRKKIGRFMGRQLKKICSK